MESKQSGKVPSKHRSPAQAHVNAAAAVVDVSDNEQNEAQLKFNKDKLWEFQKINSVKLI
jgi:hypothetical protein